MLSDDAGERPGGGEAGSERSDRRGARAVVDARLAIPGFQLGHGSDVDGGTGVTVILGPGGVRSAAVLRGSATGTRQFDSLVDLRHVATRCHGLVFAGGSAFGLSAADEVVRVLEERGAGFATGLRKVPIVPAAVLFDLGFADPTARPGAALVRAACADASDGPVRCGSVGAGTGATVGKARGLECAMKGGFGFAALEGPGFSVAAAVVVNAFGDVRHPDSGEIVAGCRVAADRRGFADARRVLAALPADTRHPWSGNTTLAAVLTDADLGKVELMAVGAMAFGAFHRCLAPAASPVDGDLLVVLSTAARPAHPLALATLAEEAVARAIVCGVEAADGFGRVPSVRDLPRLPP